MTTIKEMSTINQELKNFHNLLNDDCLDKKLFISIDQIKTKIVEFDCNNRGYLSLVLKYLVKTNNKLWLKITIQQYIENLRVNDFLLLMSYYNKIGPESLQSIESYDSTLFFEKHYLTNHFSSKSIKFLIENNLNEFISKLDGYYTILNEKDVNSINHFFGDFKLEFLNESEYNLLENYHKNENIFNEITRCDILSDNDNYESIINCFVSEILQNINFKNACNKYIESINIFLDDLALAFNNIFQNMCILDCGNILHGWTNGKINSKSYKYLIKVIEKLNEIGKIPLLVIHSKHLNKNRFRNDNEIKKSIDYILNKFKDLIFITPYGENDDYFILLFCIIGGISKIITKDNFGDHFSILTNSKNKLEYQFKYFLDDVKVKYNLDALHSIEFSKNLNREYSNCIQIIDNYVYIPTDKKRFIKYKLYG